MQRGRVDIVTDVREWQFYFRLRDGLENREKVLNALVDFFDNPEAMRLSIPGKCKLGGRFDWSRELGFYDGYEIEASYVDFIFRTNAGALLPLDGSRYSENLSDKMFCVQVSTGRRFIFKKETMSHHMKEMLNDVREGKLNNEANHYLTWRYRNRFYI